MSGGKQTPRQAMVGMMYLVLLAMLAMNASKDLLDAFIFLENGIEVTTDNFSSGTEGTYQKINSAAMLGSKLAISTQKNAQEIKTKTDALFTLINDFKQQLIEIGGGVDPETNIPLGKDNQDIGSAFIMTGGNGEVLRKQIEEFKTYLVGIIDPQDTALVNSIHALLSTPEYIDPEGVKMPWETGLSEHLPLVAVTANLTNVQSYIKNAEAQVLNYMYDAISSDTYKVNKIMAASIAKSSYVMQGEEYNANIFLAASDTTQEPIILVGDYDTTLFQQTGKVVFNGKVDTIPVRGGKGIFNTKTDKTGNFSWKGIMKIPHPNPKRKGEYLNYPFENQYTVAAPSAVISSADLNIMYKGVGNKIEVSVPGIPSDRVKPIAQNCTVREISPGKYEFKPTKTGEMTIQVMALMPDGTSQLMGTQKWKVKGFPTPDVYLGQNQRPGKVKKNILIAIGGIQVKYSPEFPISANPDFKKCKFEAYQQGNYMFGGIMNNGKFSAADLKNIKERLKKGDLIYFEEINVIDPSGNKPKIPDYMIKID